MKKIVFLVLACLFSTVHIRADVKKITSVKQFNDMLLQSPLMVAEFYSESCPHCIRFNKSGALDALAQELRDVVFVQINSGLTDLFKNHLVKGVPTFIFFKNGSALPQHTIVGAPNSEAIRSRIASIR